MRKEAKKTYRIHAEHYTIAEYRGEEPCDSPSEDIDIVEADSAEEALSDWADYAREMIADTYNTAMKNGEFDAVYPDVEEGDETVTVIDLDNDRVTVYSVYACDADGNPLTPAGGTTQEGEGEKEKVTEKQKVTAPYEHDIDILETAFTDAWDSQHPYPRFRDSGTENLFDCFDDLFERHVMQVYSRELEDKADEMQDIDDLWDWSDKIIEDEKAYQEQHLGAWVDKVIDIIAPDYPRIIIEEAVRRAGLFVWAISPEEAMEEVDTDDLIYKTARNLDLLDGAN